MVGSPRLLQDDSSEIAEKWSGSALPIGIEQTFPKTENMRVQLQIGSQLLGILEADALKEPGSQNEESLLERLPSEGAMEGEVIS